MNVKGGMWDPADLKSLPEGVGRAFATRMARQGLRGQAVTEALEKLCSEHNARYQIVAKHGDREVIAEEVEELALRAFSPEVRPIATTVMRLPPIARAELIAGFTKNGGLKLPWPAK